MLNEGHDARRLRLVSAILHQEPWMPSMILLAWLTERFSRSLPDHSLPHCSASKHSTRSDCSSLLGALNSQTGLLPSYFQNHCDLSPCLSQASKLFLLARTLSVRLRARMSRKKTPNYNKARSVLCFSWLYKEIVRQLENTAASA